MQINGLHDYNSIGLFANQTSYHFESKQYILSFLAPKIKRVFVPEHGFFSELQDQVHLDDAHYHALSNHEVEYVSVYGSDPEKNLKFPASVFDGLDAILIDIQDVGVRYFTYLTSIKYMLDSMVSNKIELPIYIIDHPNSNHGIVEGSPMQSKYASFIGVEGLPHSYGVSLSSIIKWMARNVGYTSMIDTIEIGEKHWIQPSPNMPSPETCRIYTGQCLIEGTEMSEGRGTTLPFQIFGSPNLKYGVLDKIRKNIRATTSGISSLKDSWDLRPLKFIPTFHKHQGQVCNGFQLHIFDSNFHSLLFSLILLKEISNYFPRDGFYRAGVYEYGNDRIAIELLCGDDTLLAYLMGDVNVNIIIDYLNTHEKQWKKEIQYHELL